MLFRLPLLVISSLLIFSSQVLATEIDSELSERIKQASNTKSPAALLKRLATDPAEQVWLAVASNRRAPADIHMELAHDKSAEVRMGLALNINAPVQSKLILANDQNKDVKLRLAKCG